MLLWLLPYFALVVPTAIWVYRDAGRRDWTGRRDTAIGWSFACLWMWIVALPAYLIERRNAPLR